MDFGMAEMTPELEAQIDAAIAGLPPVPPEALERLAVIWAALDRRKRRAAA